MAGPHYASVTGTRRRLRYRSFYRVSLVVQSILKKIVFDFVPPSQIYWIVYVEFVPR